MITFIVIELVFGIWKGFKAFARWIGTLTVCFLVAAVYVDLLILEKMFMLLKAAILDIWNYQKERRREATINGN